MNSMDLESRAELKKLIQGIWPHNRSTSRLHHWSTPTPQFDRHNIMLSIDTSWNPWHIDLFSWQCRLDTEEHWCIKLWSCPRCRQRDHYWRFLGARGWGTTWESGSQLGEKAWWPSAHFRKGSGNFARGLHRSTTSSRHRSIPTRLHWSTPTEWYRSTPRVGLAFGI